MSASIIDYFFNGESLPVVAYQKPYYYDLFSKKNILKNSIMEYEFLDIGSFTNKGTGPFICGRYIEMPDL